MQTVEDIFHQAEIFIELFNNFATKHNLEGRIIPDHICYKCESKESFETLRALFEAESEYMYQSIISGRRIAVIRFKESIQTSVGPIYFLELSDQSRIFLKGMGLTILRHILWGGPTPIWFLNCRKLNRYWKSFDRTTLHTILILVEDFYSDAHSGLLLKK